MDMNIENYLKIYEDVIPKKTCKEIVKELKITSWEQHKFYDNITKELFNHENELSITYDEIKHRDFLMKEIWGALHAYVTDLNFTWFNAWSGYSLIRFNQYTKKTRMSEHCDHISSLFVENKGVPILSVLGSLNDNYTGGELIFFQDKQIKLEAGSIAVFPSNFLYPHKVLPVISGTRHSFVSWAW